MGKNTRATQSQTSFSSSSLQGSSSNKSIKYTTVVGINVIVNKLTIIPIVTAAFLFPKVTLENWAVWSETDRFPFRTTRNILPKLTHMVTNGIATVATEQAIHNFSSFTIQNQSWESKDCGPNLNKKYNNLASFIGHNLRVMQRIYHWYKPVQTHSAQTIGSSCYYHNPKKSLKFDKPGRKINESIANVSGSHR